MTEIFTTKQIPALEEQQRNPCMEMARTLLEGTDKVIKEYKLSPEAKGNTLKGIMSGKIAELTTRGRGFSLNLRHITMSAEDIQKLGGAVEAPDCLTRALLSESGFSDPANGKYDGKNNRVTVSHANQPFKAVCSLYIGSSPSSCKIDGFTLVRTH